MAACVAGNCGDLRGAAGGGVFRGDEFVVSAAPDSAAGERVVERERDGEFGGDSSVFACGVA